MRSSKIARERLLLAEGSLLAAFVAVNPLESPWGRLEREKKQPAKEYTKKCGPQNVVPKRLEFDLPLAYSASLRLTGGSPEMKRACSWPLRLGFQLRELDILELSVLQLQSKTGPWVSDRVGHRRP